MGGTYWGSCREWCDMQSSSVIESEVGCWSYELGVPLAAGHLLCGLGEISYPNHLEHAKTRIPEPSWTTPRRQRAANDGRAVNSDPPVSVAPMGGR